MKVTRALNSPLEFEIPNLIDPLFKMTIDTTKPGVTNNQSFELAFASSSSVNLTVDWGDGTSNVITTSNQAELLHGYASSGTYQVTLSGSFDSLYFYNNDSQKLMSIDNWGTNKWQAGRLAFRGCVNMVGTYTDNPDFSEIINMNQMFYDCLVFNSPLTINIPLCTTLAGTFDDCKLLNSAINITSSNVLTTTAQMFFNCNNFNSAITISDTSSVDTMIQMFEKCFAFNQPISFDTSSVTTFWRMFSNCTNFNQPINFVTPNLTRTDQMFEYNSNLNSSITLTDTSNVTRMDYAITTYVSNN